MPTHPELQKAIPTQQDASQPAPDIAANRHSHHSKPNSPANPRSNSPAALQRQQQLGRDDLQQGLDRHPEQKSQHQPQELLQVPQEQQPHTQPQQQPQPLEHPTHKRPATSMATRSDAAIDDEPNTAHTTTTTATTSDIHRPNLTVQQAQEPPVLGQQEGTEQVLPAQAGEQSRSEQPEQQQQQQQAGLARPLVPGLQPGQSRAEGLEGGAHVRRKLSRDQSPSMGHNPGSGATTSAVPGAADPLLASTAGGCALRQQTGSTMGSGAGILQSNVDSQAAARPRTSELGDSNGGFSGGDGHGHRNTRDSGRLKAHASDILPGAGSTEADTSEGRASQFLFKDAPAAQDVTAQQNLAPGTALEGTSQMVAPTGSLVGLRGVGGMAAADTGGWLNKTLLPRVDGDSSVQQSSRGAGSPTPLLTDPPSTAIRGWQKQQQQTWQVLPPQAASLSASAPSQHVQAASFERWLPSQRGAANPSVAQPGERPSQGLQQQLQQSPLKQQHRRQQQQRLQQQQQQQAHMVTGLHPPWNSPEQGWAARGGMGSSAGFGGDQVDVGGRNRRHQLTTGCADFDFANASVPGTSTFHASLAHEAHQQQQQQQHQHAAGSSLAFEQGTTMATAGPGQVVSGANADCDSEAAGAATLKAAQEKEALMAELSALTIAHSGALQGLGEEIVELNSRLLLKDQEVQRLTERVQELEATPLP
ncbi:MAG: hypothetical protein WDW38_003198 [Sanguina aurantia]